MTGAQAYVLAGFVAGFPWRPPAQDWAADLPRVVTTVSDCLADFLPADQGLEAWQKPLFEPWHRTAESAARAVEHAPPNLGAAHVLSMSVPSTSELAALIEGWIGDLPHPIRTNLARAAVGPPGVIQGFEVLGFDAGRFHSWLCYRLDEEVRGELGIRMGGNGLLTTIDDARLVADLANGNDGTPDDIAWFPVLVTEHDSAG